jgi:hypothetical protein
MIFPNRISHQIQKEKTIWMMMVRMDEFFFQMGTNNKSKREREREREKQGHTFKRKKNCINFNF